MINVVESLSEDLDSSDDDDGPMPEDNQSSESLPNTAPTTPPTNPCAARFGPTSRSAIEPKY